MITSLNLVDTILANAMFSTMIVLALPSFLGKLDKSLDVHSLTLHRVE